MQKCDKFFAIFELLMNIKTDFHISPIQNALLNIIGHLRHVCLCFIKAQTGRSGGPEGEVTMDAHCKRWTTTIFSFLLNIFLVIFLCILHSCV